MMLSTLMCALALLPATAPVAHGPLWVQLGTANRGNGLAVPSAGDGTNTVETLGGSTCRRITGPRSLYLYVKADEKLIPPGAYDAYLSVEYFDDQTRIVRVEYDQAPVDRTKNSAYTKTDDQLLTVGSGRWRRGVIHFPGARFGHGQNGGADLRLVGQGLAVRRIEVTFSRPADYHAGGIDLTALNKIRSAAGQGMELDMGCDASPGEAALFRALGYTSVESYVTWQTVEDAGEGQWDWSRWDRQVEILQAAGLKWAPLLVAGPAYSLPQWYRDSDRLLGYVCLEHGKPSKIASLWDPQLRPWIDRFIKAFADRYRDRGVIELVRLGSTGTYGETLYPSGPTTGWTHLIPGPHHNHLGWWAGDRLAVASFRKCMRQRYREIAALNRAWNTHYADFDAVAPMLPQRAPSLRARLDMVNWYVDSMTEFGVFWAATARKYFPHTPVYQSLGGVGEPILGADFSAQARALASCGARVRVTNEGSNYDHNFAMTREVVSAARAFGLDFGFEPAGKVSAEGNVARIYNTAASGGIHFFSYKGNILDNAAALAAFRQNAPYLQRRWPVVQAALYLPKTAWALDDDSVHHVLAAARDLRRRVDFELLDRTTIASPLAQRAKVLAIPQAAYAEPQEIENLRHWVEAGGILVARVLPDQPLLRTPEGSDTQRNALLATPPAGSELFRDTLRGPAPRRFRLAIGTSDDSSYLEGDWHAREHGGMFPGIPGAGMRWTRAKAGCWLPCDPAADATLTLIANLTPKSLPGVNRVLVNGVPVGRLDKTGVQTYRFPVSKQQLAGRAAARVTLEVRTFRPAEHGNRDTRELGVAVCAFELCVRGAEQEPCGTASLAWELDWAKAASWTRRIGKGATLAVPCPGSTQFTEAVIQALVHPERLIPGARAVSVPVDNVEHLYATQFTDGMLYYNASDRQQQVGRMVVPASGIGWQPSPVSPPAR
jgi:hypothetical protein